MNQSMVMYCDRSELINANDRLHWRVKSGRTKALRWKATAFARDVGKALKPVTERQHVTITYGWTKPRRIRDAGNLQPTSKALVDGLTDAGIWPDDNDAWVIGPDDRFGEPSDRPGLVKITIELEDA